MPKHLPNRDHSESDPDIEKVCTMFGCDTDDELLPEQPSWLARIRVLGELALGAILIIS